MALASVCHYYGAYTLETARDLTFGDLCLLLDYIRLSNAEDAHGR